MHEGFDDDYEENLKMYISVFDLPNFHRMMTSYDSTYTVDIKITNFCF